MPIVKCNKQAIRQFVNHVRTYIKALATLKLPVDKWDAVLIFVAANKLDYYTHKEWETHISSKGQNELPKIDELLEFLTGRYHMLEMVEKEKSGTEARKHSEKRSKKSLLLASTSNNGCEYCTSHHHIFSCEKLLKLPILSRIKEIRSLKLCLNCLRKGHWSKECRSSGCKICQAKHNSLLHVDNQKENEETSKDNANNSLHSLCKKVASCIVVNGAGICF
ncbi:PREDICTED: uncharacterized protein LOC108764662 [Trachymyrmex cornetzi]|uniref:uncharacterized protein LOC108764662 n=1 Tax=Trachymyrmex cornetzi TaxID=471704 RepID=UPI00084EE25A|nr:PREDICTED: uncharacterized protein LOC108764662 [Trachymyrmex cornetzi]